MSSLLGHCHGENWKSPTRSFERSGKAKRTFEERKKNNLHLIHNAQLPHKLNRHLPNSQPFQTANHSCFKSYFGKHCTPFTSTPALVGVKQVPHRAINHLRSSPHVSLPTHQHVNKPTHQLVNKPLVTSLLVNL